MQWDQLTDGGMRCLEHGETFRLPATCSACAAADPATLGDLDIGDSDDADADGCLTPADHERRFTRMADRLERKASELKKGTPRELAMSAKFYEICIRARRAAAELSHERHRRARVARLERNLREARRH